MYFSKNSRYVLSRANWLSPSSYFFNGLRGINKNLSVKSPQEDPTKPPLRVNVPNDHQNSDLSYTKRFQDSVHINQQDYTIEPRSRSVITRSKASPISASLEEDFLRKSESEIQLPSYEESAVLSETSEGNPIEQSNSQNVDYTAETLKPKENFETGKEQNETENSSEGIEAVVNEKALDEALANNFLENQQPQPQKLDTTPNESLDGSAQEDQKSLYIIIDVPEKSEEKSVNAADDSSIDKSYSSEPQSDTSNFPKATPNWLKSDSFQIKSRSLSKLSSTNPEGTKKPDTKTRFEVREIDDASSYVHHLKFKKNLGGRPSTVGCVPEKEVNIRAYDMSYNDAPIRVRETAAGRSFNAMGKEVTAIQDISSLVKYPDSKKKPRAKNAKNFSGKTRRVNSSLQSLKPKKEVIPDEGVTPKETQYDQPLLSNYEAFQTKIESQNGYKSLGSQNFRSESAPQLKAEVAEYSGVGEEIAQNGSSKLESQSKIPDYSNSYKTQFQETQNPSSYSQYQYAEYPSNQEPRVYEFKQEPKALGKKNSYKKINKYDKKRGNLGISSRYRFHSDSKIFSGGAEPSDFKTCKNVINISSERTSSYPMKFSAAFPPTLSRAMRSQVRNMALQRESLFNHKWTTKIDFRPKDFEVNPKAFHEAKVPGLAENSSLSSKKKGKFNCESLLVSKKDGILNVTKEESPKLSDNMINVANEHLTENKGKTSLDSLTMMKKVKDIVNFDLNNAIKIFDQSESCNSQQTLSVADKNKNSFELKKNEGKEFPDSQKSKTEKQLDLDVRKGEKDAKIGDANLVPKYLPPVKENEIAMKLDNSNFNSVVTFNPESNEFVINETELENAIKKREPLGDAIIQKLEEILKEEESTDSAFLDRLKFEMKSGDSILVFDEETQTWKVDFSILERREEQQRQEQELTKRSELILETFEKLEQAHINNIPKPSSPEKRTFDYSKGEWKIYKPERKSSPKSKSKLPFKESDAEEIRKKNADMYEDLFVTKKKETTMNKSGQEGLDSSSSKADKSCAPTQKKEAKSSGGPTKESGTTPTKPEPPKVEKGTPENKPKPDNLSGKIKDDDGYWGTFLRLNILPKDISEIKDIKIPPAPPKIPPSPPAKKIEDPKTKTPPKKIEEPRFRIPLPFRGDKKIDNSKAKVPPAKGNQKMEDPKVKPKQPPGAEKKEPIKDPSVKAPSVKTPPSGSVQRIEDPKTKPPPTIGAPKIEDPKSKPAPIGDPKTDDSKSKTPPTSNTPKTEDPKSKPPPTIGAPKADDSKSKPPTTTGAAKIDDPRSKPPPTIGAPKISDPKVEPPSPTASPSKADDSSVKSAGPSGNAKMEDREPKTSPPLAGDKKDKSAADHYISENIVEMSKKDKNSKIKPNKIETVKLNITSDKRMPSKITEINLNKKYEEKESKAVPKKQEGDKKNEKCVAENKTFYQNFEKYKTPLMDPEFEEKSMKINSDIESNPNLKKLDNWNKTLVLHEIVKPPENVESWLKDETDKMATLLLKVLQEAADGKPRKKPAAGKSKSCDKLAYKGNPYDNIRKKQETTPEQFLFKVRSVNIALDDVKKKPAKELKSEPVLNSIPVQSARTAKPPAVVDAVKVPSVKEVSDQTERQNSKLSLLGFEAESKDTKSKITDLSIDSILGQKEVLLQNKTANELTEEIPGPEILKKISSAWRVFPVLSCQMTIFTLFRIFQIVNSGASFFSANPEKSRRNAFGKLFTKYGPIVNIQGPLSGSVILIHKPEHLSGVFEQDVSTPARSVFDSLDQSRKETEDKIQDVGTPTNWNNPEWNDLKKAMNDPLNKGCEKLFDSVELAGEALVGNIRRNRNGQSQVSEDFMDEIKRWSMEGLCNALFEKTFSFLEGRSHNVDWVLEPEKLYTTLDEATDCLSKCERGFQTWRLMATPSSIGLSQAYSSLSAILSKQLYQAEVNLKNKNELLKLGTMLGSQDMTFVESMLLNDGMSMNEVTCNLIDIMIMGVNTMSSALGFLLYDLALNVRVQNKLLKEVKEVLPDKNGRLDYHKLHSLKYLQACLKESLRMHTPLPIFFRVLQNDIMLSNYVIPKGTYVVMDSKINSMKEQIFEEPEKFNPDRWLGDESTIHSQNPIFSYPFCHGPRAELAKRVAELQLWSCITKVVRNFQIEYHYGEIQGSETLISLPDKPLKLNFVERDE